MGSVSFGRQDVTFSGNSTYTLTTSYVASDAISTKFVKKFSLYGYYTPGAGGDGNGIKLKIEINPFTAKEDSTNLYWAPIGRYIDTAGDYDEEPAVFIPGNSTTASTQYNIVPVDIVDPSAAQIRIKVEEVVVSGSAGHVRLMVGSNTIN